MKPILLVGEFHDDQSARFDRPLVGPSGAELLRMLNESGIISFTSSRLAQFGTMYEKFLFTKLNMHYTPSVGSGQAGSILLAHNLS